MMLPKKQKKHSAQEADPLAKRPSGVGPWLYGRIRPITLLCLASFLLLGLLNNWWRAPRNSSTATLMNSGSLSPSTPPTLTSYRSEIQGHSPLAKSDTTLSAHKVTITPAVFRLRQVERLTTLSDSQRERLLARFEAELQILRDISAIDVRATRLAQLEPLSDIIGSEVAAAYEARLRTLEAGVERQNLLKSILELGERAEISDEVRNQIPFILPQIEALALSPWELRSYLETTFQELFASHGQLEKFEALFRQPFIALGSAELTLTPATSEMQEQEILYLRQSLELDPARTASIRELQHTASRNFTEQLNRLVGANASAEETRNAYALVLQEVQLSFEKGLKEILTVAQYLRYQLEKENALFSELDGETELHR